jgi:hypothetical protein
MADVKTYLTSRWLDGAWYGERICARNFDEAQEFAKRAGVRLDGEFMGTIPAIAGGHWLANLIIGVRNALRG